MTLSDQIKAALLQPTREVKAKDLNRLKKEAAKKNFTNAEAYISSLLNSLTKWAPSNAAIYIFYHDDQLLSKSLNKADPGKIANHDSVYFINLNEVELPHEFLIKGETKSINKAMLSEYLGICQIDPPEQASIIGCFTYSIPLKFSNEWAEESGNSRLFLPALNFEEILDTLPDLREDLLYGVEFKSPLSDDPGPVREYRNSTRESPLSTVGPYKGSFVCRRAAFSGLQIFLKQQITALLQKPESALVGVTSKYDTSAASGRSPRSRSVDKRRHTYGTSIERFLALYFSYQYNLDQMVDLRSIVRYKELLTRDWKRLAVTVSHNKRVIITFCNQSYLKTLSCWIQLYKKTGNKNLLVFALDQETKDYCESHGVSSHYIRIDIASSGLSRLWRERLLIARDLVKLGLSVTLTDIDAFWLDDPSSHLFDPNYDIVSSVGTRFPPQVYEAIGKVLCFGLICFNPTPKTLRVLNRCVDTYDKFQDDQRCLNFILLEAGLKISQPEHASITQLPMPDSETGLISFNDTDLHATTECGLRVKLLSHKLFQRIFDGTQRPIVSHLLSPKDCESKQYCLDRINDYPVDPSNQILSRSTQDSSIVWLASYPRSGNTMLRGLLNNSFMIKSSSIYNDLHDIGASSDISEQYGHVHASWNFADVLPTDKELLCLKEHDFLSGSSYIKTHACFSKGYKRGKTIYIYRNGLDAIASHAQYRLDFGVKGGTSVQETIQQELESLIINGAPMCGYWSDNLKSWLGYASVNRDKCLILRFESVIKDFKKTASSIEQFTGCFFVNQTPPLFKHAQSLNNKFFRKGGSNRDLYCDPNILSLFFAFEHEGMALAQYIPKEPKWFCVSSDNEFLSVNEPFLSDQEKSILLYIAETALVYSQEIKSRQIGSRNIKLAKIISMSCSRKAHLRRQKDVQVINDFCSSMQRLIKGTPSSI